MSSNENLDLQLSKGSQWLRKDGSQVKFLFLTNQSLSPRVQENHPPQVIYADVEGNVFNRDVDDFLKIYQFYNVDGELEQRLNRLITFNPQDYSTIKDDEDDDQVIQITDDEDEDSIIPTVAKPTETLAEELLRELTASNEEETHLTVTFALSQHPEMRNPALTAEDLSREIVLYSNEPNDNFEITVHRLLFPLSGKITEESLREVFHPSTEVNTVDYFTVLTKFRRDEIVWDSWIGIVPEYSVNGLYAAVLIGTANKTLDTAPTPGVDSVDVREASQPAQVADEFDPAAILAQAAPAEEPEALTQDPVVDPVLQVDPTRDVVDVILAEVPQPVVAPVAPPPPIVTPIVVHQPPVIQVMAQ